MTAAAAALLFLIGSCCVALPSLALPYRGKGPVTVLTKANFAKEVMSSAKPWVVEFYAPWCGHCKNLQPDYERAAKKLDGFVGVGAVDCDVEKEICGAFGVQGFPTIKGFGQKLVPTKDGKGQHKVPVDYNGPRSAKGLSQFGINLLKGFVKKVTDENADEFASFASAGEANQGLLAKALLVTDKSKVTPMFKAISTDFHRGLTIGQALASKAPQLVEKHAITSFPALLVFTDENTAPIKYDGEMKREAITDFLKQYAAVPYTQPAEEEKPASPPPPPPEHKHSVREVVASQEELEKTCFDTNMMCFIALLDPQDSGHAAAVDALEAVSKKSSLDHVFKVVWVDGTTATDMPDALGIQPYFPAGAVYNHRKSRVVPFVGSFTERSVTGFLEKILRGARGTSGYDAPKKPSLGQADAVPAPDA